MALVFAKIEVREEALMLSFSRQAQGILDQFKAQELANTVWAFAKLEVKDEASRDFAGGSLQLSCRNANGSHTVTGAVFADGDLRITSIDAFPVNVTPSSHMLFTRHRDMPGIIGHLGSLLGEHNVNIASMQVGRKIVRGDAVMVLSIDDPIPADLLQTITAIDGIQEAHPVTL